MPPEIQPSSSPPCDLPTWPVDLHPDRVPVYAYNERLIEAPARTLFNRLVRAGEWPTFYKNARSVEIDGGAAKLTPGCHFVWTTFGLRIAARVEEFLPERRLAWRANVLGADVYHRWDLMTQGRDRTLVVTEEVQRGGIARIAPRRITGMLRTAHEEWLRSLGEYVVGHRSGLSEKALHVPAS